MSTLSGFRGLTRPVEDEAGRSVRVAVLDVHPDSASDLASPWAEARRLLVRSLGATVFDLVTPATTPRRLASLLSGQPTSIFPPIPSGVHFDHLVVLLARAVDLPILEAVDGWRSLATRVTLVHLEANDSSGALAGPLATRAFSLIATTHPAIFGTGPATVLPIEEALDTTILALPPSAERDIDLLVPGHQLSPARRRMLARWGSLGGARLALLPDLLASCAGAVQPVHEAMTSARFVLVDDPAAHGPTHVVRDLEPDADDSPTTLGVTALHALAAGCGIVGRFPIGGDVHRRFGHLPGVIDLGPGGGTPGPLVDLLRDRGALSRVAALHRADVLRRHDVTHRVAHLLDALGIARPGEVTRRMDALESLAAATVERAGRPRARFGRRTDPGRGRDEHAASRAVELRTILADPVPVAN